MLSFPEMKFKYVTYTFVLFSLVAPLGGCSSGTETKDTRLKTKKHSTKKHSTKKKKSQVKKRSQFKLKDLKTESQKRLKKKYESIKQFWNKAQEDEEVFLDFDVFDHDLNFYESSTLINYAKSKENKDKYAGLVAYKLHLDLEEYAKAREQAKAFLQQEDLLEREKYIAYILITHTLTVGAHKKEAQKTLNRAKEIDSSKPATILYQQKLAGKKSLALKQILASVDKNSAHSLRFAGSYAIQKRSPQTSIKLFNQAQKLSADDPRTMIGQAKALSKLKQKDKAFAKLNETQKFNSSKLLDYLTRADLYRSLKKNKIAVNNLAIKDYTQHYINVGSKKCILKSLSSKLEKIKRPSLLLASTNRWLSKNSRDSRGIHLRACILHGLNKPKKAIKAHTHAIKRAPEEATYYVARAQTWLASLNSKEALKDLNIAIDDLGLLARTPLKLRAQAYTDLGEYEKAIKDYSACIEVDTKNGEIYYERALAYMQLNKPEEAKSDLLKRISLTHKTPNNSYKNLAFLYDSTGDYENALKYYNYCLEDNPGHSAWKLYQRRANLYSKLESWQAAIDDYTRVLKINKLASGAYLKRGQAYLKLGKLEQANQDIKKAKSMDDYVFGD